MSLTFSLTREVMLPGKARRAAHCLLKTYCHTYDDAASTGGGVQQSRQDMVASLTSLSATSSAFTFLFKVLLTVPSWYLLAIGLEPISLALALSLSLSLSHWSCGSQRRPRAQGEKPNTPVPAYPQQGL